MHRRIAPILLAVLIALPSVVPVSAIEPQASPPVDPAAAPTPPADPTPPAEPTPPVEPTPDVEPSANPVEPVPPAEPPPDPIAPPDLVGSTSTGVVPDADGRFIVMLRNGSDTAAVVEKARKHDGIKAEKSFIRAFRGFAAKLDKKQRLARLADPSVVAVVPDEVINLTQTVPTG